MNKLLLLALLATASPLRAIDDPPAPPPAGPRAEETTAPATPAVPSATVTAPAEGGAAPAEPDTPAVPPEGLSFEPARETPPAEVAGDVAAAAGELRFTDRLLADPEADITTPRVSTNALRIQGIGARAVRPSKFGSFFQLFNPLAPVEEGMEAQPVYWYDGQLNTAAKPRGLRDDRTETPVGGVVVSVGK